MHSRRGGKRRAANATDRYGLVTFQFLAFPLLTFPLEGTRTVINCGLNQQTEQAALNESQVPVIKMLESVKRNAADYGTTWARFQTVTVSFRCLYFVEPQTKCFVDKEFGDRSFPHSASRKHNCAVTSQTWHLQYNLTMG